MYASIALRFNLENIIVPVMVMAKKSVDGKDSEEMGLKLRFFFYDLKAMVHDLVW
jgi:hypothetical protein